MTRMKMRRIDIDNILLVPTATPIEVASPGASPSELRLSTAGLLFATSLSSCAVRPARLQRAPP
jgi:hypothetical protein